MEWISMLNIIYQQADRNINEILYDFNAENLNEEIDRADRHQITYRKKEIRMKKCFLMWGAINCPISIFLWISSSFVSFPTTLGLINNISVIVYIFITQFLLLPIVFVLLMYQLKKRHVFEYNEHKKSIYMFFLVNFIHGLVYMYIMGA